MPFNIRVIDYPEGKQVRVYEKAVGMSGEAAPGQKPEEEGLSFNPFTGTYERVRTDADAGRCLRTSMARTVNRLYYLSRSNRWEWFVTLTFSPDQVDRFDYDACVKRLSKWLNNGRRKAPDLKYLVVPEQHKSGAWHFHGLFSCCDGLRFTDSGHKDRKGKKIYNVGSYRLGFTTATRVTDTEKVSKYISKYITKELCAVTFRRKRFWASRNLLEAPVVDYCLEAEEKKRFLEGIADGIKYMKTIHSIYCRTDYIELAKETCRGPGSRRERLVFLSDSCA